MFLLPDSCWEIRKTKHKGLGVFAKKDIEAGTVIGDYLGQIIPANQEEFYEKKYGFYGMYYSSRATIFPNVKSTGIHLINNSCAPNCWMYTYKGHTLYFAIRKIFANEELNVSYLLAPQDKDCNPCTDQCLCGSFNCSQTMHLPKQKYDSWTKFDDAIAKTTKRSRVKINHQLSALSQYPKKIADHKIYTLIGSQEKKAIRFNNKRVPKISEIREKIRQTGRFLRFSKLDLTVYGINDGLLIAAQA